MDTAVALVRSYLQANGFFTISEYPILESLSDQRTRTVTDVDVLGVRFPGAGDSGSNASMGGLRTPPHEALGLDDTRIEVIIGEVKEGAAILNRAATDRDVLLAIMRRLGRMEPEVAEEIVTELAESGESFHPAGIRVRLVVFSAKPPKHPNPSLRPPDVPPADAF